MFLLCVLLPQPSARAAGPVAKIGYLTLHGPFSPEDSCAVEWLEASECGTSIVLDLITTLPDQPGVDLVWVNIPDSTTYIQWTSARRKLQSLRQFYRNGGRLLFTGVAAMLPYEIGIESERPEIRAERISDDWLFDEKGIQGFRGHPVFDGLFGGTYLWDTDHDNTVYRAGYFGHRRPREGKVVGIEKSNVAIDSDSKLMIEYNQGKGRAIAVGGFTYFSRPNSVRSHVEKFMKNVIEYLLGQPSLTKPTYWIFTKNMPKTFTVETSTVMAPEWPEKLPSTGLQINRPKPQNNFFDLAGHRALVMGRENGGIDEIWVHPFRILRDFQAALVTDDSIQWLRDLPVSLVIRPESITRTYTTPSGLVTEVIFPSLDKGGAVVCYSIDSTTAPISLLITWRCDLRLMWPYDERALGDLYYGYDDSLRAFHVKDLSGDFSCVMGADRSARNTLQGRYAGLVLHKGVLKGVPTYANQVYHGAIYDLPRESGNKLTVVLAGGDEGRERTLSEYRAIISRPGREFTVLVQHYDELLKNMVTIDSPDERLNDLWKWTLVGVDRFVTTTPGLGRALVAGFSTVDRGWDGGQKISGRPGYAWYFGRDAEWSGFAIDAYGDFRTVRDELEFLQKYQDITGKILHEMSTSGAVHYDAADATPLYVLLAADYLRASGDTAFIRNSWPNIRKAMDFLYSTDTDGDQLIENTNVGHGWVEGGKLWPPHTEFYLAGIWAQALDDASWMASRLGVHDLAARYGMDAETVKKKVDTEFWSQKSGNYSFSKLKSGSFNTEQTVLPAPVMSFGWLDETKVDENLRSYAGNSFTTNWGVRILRGDSPLYDPRGYHSGSVWPLFTGWTALAEYEYGNSTQAFSHILDNLLITRYWAAGFVQEVMNGSAFRPSGVCPHQCWSETNILHPAIHGMIGWKPDAVNNSVTIQPRFPLNWPWVVVHNLRVGQSVVWLKMWRSIDSTSYQLVLRSGPAIHVKLAPEIPQGMSIERAWVNGEFSRIEAGRRRGLLAVPVEFHLLDSTTFSFHHTGGIGLAPLAPEAIPEDSAIGTRIVSATLAGNEYRVDVEGKPGSDGIVTALTFDNHVTSVDGAVVLPREHKGELRMKVSFRRGEKPVAEQRIVIRLAGG